MEVCRDNWTSNENTCFEGWIGRKGMAWNEARNETCAFFPSFGDCNKGSKQQKVGMGPTSDRKTPARKRLLLVVVTCILCLSRPWTHSNVHL